MLSGKQKITKPRQKAELFNETFINISKMMKTFIGEKDFHEQIRQETQQARTDHPLHAEILIDAIRKFQNQ